MSMLPQKWLLLAMALALTACAPKTDQDVSSSSDPSHNSSLEEEPELSPQAQKTFHYLQALDYKAYGDYEQAVLSLEKALVIGPDPYLYQELARAYWSKGQRGEAVSTLQKALERFPQNPELYHLLAEFYLGQDKQSQALQTLENYLELVPEDWETYQNIAYFYIDMQEFAQAVDLLQQVPETQRTPEINYLLGRAQNELGNSSQAIRHLRSAVEQQPDFLRAWLEKAYIHEQQRNYLQAERTYRQILNLGETSPDLVMRIVELNLLLNDPDQALDIVSEVSLDTRFQLDVIHEFIDSGFYDHARSLIQNVAAAEEYPGSIYFYRALISYEGENDPDQALEYLQEVSEEDPNHLQARSFQVQMHFELEQYEQALKISQGLQENYPDVSRPYLFEAVILEFQEKYDQAMSILEKALQRWPQDTDLLFRKGVIWDKKEEQEKSLQVMEEVISIDQEHHEALNYVGYTLAEQDQDLERALILVEKAIEMDPGNGYYIDSLAWIYYRQGDYSRAWEEIQRAVDYVDDDPVIWEHYGDIAKAVSKVEKALQGYELALEHDPDDPERIREQMDKLRLKKDQGSARIYQ